MSTLPLLPQPVPCVQAPAHWQCVDFISDLHLDAAQPDTFQAWAQYMERTRADALFILGDLFEVWVGDDTQDSFALQCIEVLHATAQRLPVYFMCGNRDFLVGQTLLNATGMQSLHDPTVLVLHAAQGVQRFLLSHGDALCLNDHAYLAFRAQVREPAWQTAFLAQPRIARETYARQVRNQSETHKKDQGAYADVDDSAARAWLQASHAQALVHGHTHQPAAHDLGDGLSRWVLSDWDAHSQPARLQILRWTQASSSQSPLGLHRIPVGAEPDFSVSTKL